MVPGSARQMIDEYLRAESVTSDAVERLSIAEAFALRIGVLGSLAVTLAAFGVATTLFLAGHDGGAVLALVPVLLASSAQIVGAVRRRS